MRRDDIDLLLDHLSFVRDRVLTAARGVPDGLADPDAPTQRDLHTTLVHELDVEWSWRERLESDDPTDFGDATEELTVGDLPTLEAIEARWRDDETAMRAWIARLGDKGLEGPCHAEDPSRHPMWFHVMHLYTHAIQQFADAATLLTRAGQSPGELDFLDFVEVRLDGRRDGGS
jgi:uncharacterized damage-inducible protein DinB